MKEIDKLKKDLESLEDKIPVIYLNETFEEIEKLKDASSVKIDVLSQDIKNCPAIISKDPNGGFELVIPNMISDITTPYDIEITNETQKFQVKNLYIALRSTKLERKGDDKFLTGNMSSRAHIRDMSTISFSDQDSFYRFVIPFSNGDLMSFIYSKGYKNETMLWARGMIRLNLQDQMFTICETSFKKAKYLIIDSGEKLNFERFAEICHSVMIGYGFLSGNFIQDEAYYLKSDDIKFQSMTGISYQKLRQSILTYGTANPIHLSSYGYTRDQSIIDKVGHFLEIFDENLFSKFCNKIINESEYGTLILLVIESNKASLILKPAGYAVALEKITNIIAEENAGLKPIPDKKLSREFIAKMQNLLQEYKSEIENCGNNDSMIILEKNIARLNSPTNQDKLTKPFMLYDIILKPDDIVAIGRRNSFLHGKTLQIEEGSSEFMEIYMTALRLNKLVNKLILKHLGFSGYIVNHLKHNEASFPVPINEDLFEVI